MVSDIIDIDHWCVLCFCSRSQLVHCFVLGGKNSIDQLMCANLQHSSQRISQVTVPSFKYHYWVFVPSSLFLRSRLRLRLRG